MTLDDMLPGAIFVIPRDGVVAQLGMFDNWISPVVMKDYHLCKEPPHYPLPALREYGGWGNNKEHVSLWYGVMQMRISDIPYTGFGKVITFDLISGECECRYSDFD